MQQSNKLLFIKFIVDFAKYKFSFNFKLSHLKELGDDTGTKQKDVFTES
jgi:hypothetical protein